MASHTDATAGTEMRVVPGPIRGGHCPAPREIVLVDARKVFDFCSQEDLLERCFTLPDLGADGSILSCRITQIQCEEVADRQPVTNGDEGRAIVSIQITLTLQLQVQPTMGAQPVLVERTVTFPKRVVLCAPEGTDVTCDVEGTCICTVQPGAGEGEPNVCCTIQLCTVLTVTADVKLLVPAFGSVRARRCPSAASVQGCPPEVDDCDPPVRFPVRRRERDRDCGCGGD